MGFVSLPVADLDVVSVNSNTASVSFSNVIPFTLVDPAHLLVLVPLSEHTLTLSDGLF